MTSPRPGAKPRLLPPAAATFSQLRICSVRIKINNRYPLSPPGRLRRRARCAASLKLHKRQSRVGGGDVAAGTAWSPRSLCGLYEYQAQKSFTPRKNGLRGRVFDVPTRGIRGWEVADGVALGLRLDGRLQVGFQPGHI